jgi:hypothetical protein
MSTELLLEKCDIQKCEAMCCYDGTYLSAEEETLIKELVATTELKSILPDDFIVDGYWNGSFYGRKTATKFHNYKNKNYPLHFAKTRCVFADENGLCELQKLAKKHNKHEWSYKPNACWLFPLSVKNDAIVSPPISKLNDPHKINEYDGYVTFVTCGSHNENGKPWKQTLWKELNFYEKSKR